MNNPFKNKKKFKARKLRLGNRRFDESDFDLKYYQEAFDLESKRKFGKEYVV